jgi:hypothetical protein
VVLEHSASDCCKTRADCSSSSTHNSSRAGCRPSARSVQMG